MPTPARSVLLFAVLVGGALPAQFAFEPPERNGLQHFPGDGLAARKSTFVDLDGDGDLDVVTTGREGTRTLQRFYANDGHGVFTARAAWPDVANSSYHLVADVDGDGDPDVLLDSAIVRNLGAGVLQFAPSAAVGRPVACADFDGDGLRDLFVANSTGLGVGVFRQVGGGFVAAPVPTADVRLTDASAGDFDGDGDVDLLLAANRYTVMFGPNWPGNDRLWRNNGQGQFTEQYLPGAQNSDTLGMVVADFDGDGDRDCALLAVPFLFPDWELRLNDGLGNLVTTPGRLPTNLPREALLGADLDGDGDQDLVGPNLWHENDGTARVTTRTYAPPRPAMAALDAGDVDGDGDLDLVVDAGRPQRLLVSLAPGQFVDASRQRWSHTTLGSGDVDGDGDVDLLATITQTNLPGVLGLNDGTGWFAEMPFPWPTGQVLPASVQIVDVDGDTDRDVLCVFSASTGGTHLRLFRNHGAATFTDVGVVSTPAALSTNTMAAAVLDAEGDGDLDVVTIVRQGGVFLHTNDGTGAFTTVPGAFPAYLGWLRTVAVGDLDGDGDTDVLTGDESYGSGPPSAIRYFANDGTGTFTDVSAQRLQAPTSLTREVALADLDGDGDLDAFAACWGTASYPNSVNLLLRNSGGILTHQPSALPGTLPNGTVTLGDLDRDGDLDAVVGSYNDGLRFWANQGTGVFVDAGGMFPPPSTRPSDLAHALDVDEDLDVDLLLGEGVFTNSHWGADAPLLCRVGQPFPYTVRTTTGAAVALPFFGLPFARIPLPPFGTLAMPPNAPLLLPSLHLTGGTAQITLPIPPVPGLVGLEFVLQSLFLGAAPHLSPAARLPVHF